MWTLSSSVDAMNTFDVDHEMNGLVRDTVPFDSYYFAASAFVIEKATNKSVPIIAFAADNGPENYIVSSANPPTPYVNKGRALSNDTPPKPIQPTCK